jgi:ribosomal protein S17E
MELRNTAIDRQADMLAAVVEAAIRLQESTKNATQNLELTARKFDNNTEVVVEAINKLGGELPRHIAGQVTSLLKEAAVEAADTMSQQWDKANAAAVNAAIVYENSSIKAEARYKAVQSTKVWIFGLGIVLGSLITIIAIFVVSK